MQADTVCHLGRTTPLQNPFHLSSSWTQSWSKLHPQSSKFIQPKPKVFSLKHHNSFHKQNTQCRPRMWIQFVKIKQLQQNIQRKIHRKYISLKKNSIKYSMQLTLKYMVCTASVISITIYCKMKESLLNLRRWKQQQSSIVQNCTQSHYRNYDHITT